MVADESWVQGTRHGDVAAEDRFGRVEAIGVEYIPEHDRDSRPWNMFAVFFGGNLAFSVIVFGWLPITFGLDWAAARFPDCGFCVHLRCEL